MTSSTREAVIQVVNRLSFSVDTRDWVALRDCLADRLHTDYTSLVGGEPAEVAADDLVAGWRGAIEPLHGIQHCLGSHLVAVDGETAVCTAQGIVTHCFRDGDPNTSDLWTCAGHYRYALKRSSQESDGAWRVHAAKFTLTWETGDRGVMERAAAAQ